MNNTGPELPANFAESIGTSIGVGVVGCFVWLGGLGLLIWSLWMLYTALGRVRPQHARLEPGLVWLLVIPIFNYVWIWFVVFKTSQSLTAAGVPGDGGRAKGVACAIAWILQVVVSVGIGIVSAISTFSQIDFNATGPGTVPVVSPTAQIIQAIVQWIFFIIAVVMQVVYARSVLRASESIPANASPHAAGPGIEDSVPPSTL